jgi:cytochrome c-type protein NapC
MAQAKAGVIRKIWEAIRGDSGRPGTIALRLVATVVVLFVGGVLIMGTGAGIIAYTNTEQFCGYMCHEMTDNVVKEYKGTIHDVNRSGVRATCSDCHVPREPIDLLKRKVSATFELWGKLTGVIDTREKFLEHRAAMAQKVWRRMKLTDSLECRNCHKDASMDPDRQSEKARARHEKAKREKLTCIDCHYAIAHDEPEGPGPQEMKM